MNAVAAVSWGAAGLILLKSGAELWFNQVNCSHVRARADAVPEALKNDIDPGTYRKSIEYTLAKGKLSRLETFYDVGLLLILLFSGVLPWFYVAVTRTLGQTAAAHAAFLIIIALVLSLAGLPFGWYHQFHLEEQFGFNTTTQKLWWLDRVKGLVLALVLGFPLLILILKLVDWTGPAWWLWAWGSLLAFQLLMSVLAPVLILPLFNKFTPLPEGSLRTRLLELAARTQFRARSVQVMDGSKRSRHSNAFFTGVGKFRKIVLFDTLIEQLTESELAAVLAHEIGHFKKKHIVKVLLFSAAASLAGFYLLALLAEQPVFYRGFGFTRGQMAPALLLFGLLSGAVTFWLSPLTHWWSRRHEYQADAYAAQVMGEPQSLIGALRKLNAKNLSNLDPAPIYSFFYYSHPTLLERERALTGLP